MFTLTNNCQKLETLLARLFSLFEYEAALYIDELGYKWYDLKNVLGILNIDENEYISDYYLMEVVNKPFISEEGVNMLLLEYDNEYQDEIKTLLTSEVMPDIKTDMMYISEHLVNDVRTMSIRYDVYVDNSTEAETKVANKIHDYTSKKMSRRQRINEKRKMTKK